MHFCLPLQPPLLSGIKAFFSHFSHNFVTGLHLVQKFLSTSHKEKQSWILIIRYIILKKNFF